MIVRESISLNNVNEALIHKFTGRWSHSDIEIYINPKSIKRMEPWLRGISDTEGNLWVTDIADTTHSEILGQLFKIGQTESDNYSPITEVSNWGTNHYDDDKWLYCGWQREGDSNTFKIAESISFDIDQYREIFDEFASAVKQKNPQYDFIVEGIVDNPY